MNQSSTFWMTALIYYGPITYINAVLRNSVMQWIKFYFWYKISLFSLTISSHFVGPPPSTLLIHLFPSPPVVTNLSPCLLNSPPPSLSLFQVHIYPIHHRIPTVNIRPHREAVVCGRYLDCDYCLSDAIIACSAAIIASRVTIIATIGAIVAILLQLLPPVLRLLPPVLWLLPPVLRFLPPVLRLLPAVLRLWPAGLRLLSSELRLLPPVLRLTL